MRRVRFRTLGCYPLTGAVESEAADIAAGRRRDGRSRPRPNGRAAPSTRTAATHAMESKKQEGYF